MTNELPYRWRYIARRQLRGWFTMSTLASLLGLSCNISCNEAVESGKSIVRPYSHRGSRRVANCIDAKLMAFCSSLSSFTRANHLSFSASANRYLYYLLGVHRYAVIALPQNTLLGEGRAREGLSNLEITMAISPNLRYLSYAIFEPNTDQVIIALSRVFGNSVTRLKANSENPGGITLAFSNQDKYLVVVVDRLNGGIELLRIETATGLHKKYYQGPSAGTQRPKQGGETVGLVVLNNGNMVAMVRNDGLGEKWMETYDLTTGKYVSRIRLFRHHKKERMYRAVISNGGKRILAALDNTLILADVLTGRVVARQVIRIKSGESTPIAITKQGRIFAYSAVAGYFTLVDVEHTQAKRVHVRGDYPILVELSPNGRYVAAHTMTSVPYVWRIYNDLSLTPLLSPATPECVTRRQTVGSNAGAVR